MTTINAKKIKPAKKKRSSKQAVLLKKKLADITKAISLLTVSKKKVPREVPRDRIEKMLAKHFSEHPKLQLSNTSPLMIWARLGIFAEDTRATLVPYIANEKWTKGQLKLLVYQICLAEKLMAAILELTNADPDNEEQ